MSFFQVHVIVVRLCLLRHLIPFQEGLANIVAFKWTPGSFWIVELCGVLAGGICQNTNLEGISNHEVNIGILGGHWVFAIIKPERLKENTTYHIDLGKGTVLVSDKVILIPYGFSHDI